VLASRSPRRSELLTAAGVRFVVHAADIDETPQPRESPQAYVLRMAEEKARAVHVSDSEMILGADTTVVLGSEILGKPIDRADATRMLTALAGKRHDVLTGVCLIQNGRRIALELASTAVWFSPMTSEEIAEYVASGEPMDKAGAYAIQGIASRWVERIDGSYTNVVGLPVPLVYSLLRQLPGHAAISRVRTRSQ
jgi:septum formation protein